MTTDLDPCLSRNGHVLRETERLAAAMRAVEKHRLMIEPSCFVGNNWIARGERYTDQANLGAIGDSPAAAVEDWLRRNPQPEAAR